MTQNQSIVQLFNWDIHVAAASIVLLIQKNYAILSYETFIHNPWHANKLSKCLTQTIQNEYYLLIYLYILYNTNKHVFIISLNINASWHSPVGKWEKNVNKANENFPTLLLHSIHYSFEWSKQSKTWIIRYFVGNEREQERREMYVCVFNFKKQYESTSVALLTMIYLGLFGLFVIHLMYVLTGKWI